jgi:hypothetical protein
MKKHLILSVMLVLTTVAAARAQRDTTATDTTDRVGPGKRPDPALPSTPVPPVPPRDAYKSVDPLVQIRLDAIPSGLKRTLMGPEYRGWENATIFQNSKTFEYSIDIRSGDTLKTFRFDKFGNALNPNTPSKDN